jgi:hypothetical protein
MISQNNLMLMEFHSDNLNVNVCFLQASLENLE